MRLYPEKLAAQLGRGLAPVYVLSGDEPLTAGELADAIRTAARADGYDERESHVVTNANQFRWDDCFSSIDNLSLFANRRIFELRLPNGKPGREGGKVLTELAANPPPDTVVLIHLPRLDNRSKQAKWAASLEQAGVWIDIYEPDARELPGWLAGRARAAGLQFEPDALTALAARTEGNLLAAQQEINRLALLLPGATITADHVTGSVADGARFDVYQLADAALNQDAARALRILLGLRREGIADALVLWAINREVIMLLNLWTDMQKGAQLAGAFKKHRIWDKRQPPYRRALEAHNETTLRRLTRRAAETDRIVKGAAFGTPDGAMQELVMLLAQPDNPGLHS
ncbi:MAG: DNA polymerase III subunit delta [Gammaproteobacteria bacterium]|nr:DNA polymerase III subunit delta [Gammaproteobacteria bacterium]